MARGDVVYIDLPLVKSSHAQGGRRPAVLVIADAAQQGNPMTMVVPFTTTLGTRNRFPFTLQVDPSPQNGLTSVSIALVFQLRAADVTHIVSVVGHIEDHHLTAIDSMIGEMLGL